MILLALIAPLSSLVSLAQAAPAARCPDLTGVYRCDPRYSRAETELLSDSAFRRVKAKLDAGREVSTTDVGRTTEAAFLEIQIEREDGQTYVTFGTDEERELREPGVQGTFRRRLGAGETVDRYGRRSALLCDGDAIIDYSADEDYAITTRGYALVDGKPTRFAPFKTEEWTKYYAGRKNGEPGLYVSTRKTTIASKMINEQQEGFDFGEARLQEPTVQFCRRATAGELGQLRYFDERRRGPAAKAARGALEELIAHPQSAVPVPPGATLGVPLRRLVVDADALASFKAGDPVDALLRDSGVRYYPVFKDGKPVAAIFLKGAGERWTLEQVGTAALAAPIERQRRAREIATEESPAAFALVDLPALGGAPLVALPKAKLQERPTTVTTVEDSPALGLRAGQTEEAAELFARLARAR